MRAQATAIILGVVVLLVGMLVASILDTQAAHSGDTAIRCTTSSTSGGTFVLISKTAANCESESGLVQGDFRVPTPTSAQLAILNGGSSSTNTATSTTIASFAGSKPLNDLIPTLVRVVLVVIGVGMIGIGGLGLMRRGPLANA